MVPISLGDLQPKAVVSGEPYQATHLDAGKTLMAEGHTPQGGS